MAHLHMNINELLEKSGKSKNAICKDLDIPRANFNRYCRDEFQRIDARLVCKLCEYFECGVGDLIEYDED
ncbi:helix-turn-helix domain-containing protein [Enterocloster asparagiformis]|nr:helix-turn-helix transcriptional regulator [Enterocloster asparagiformis]UWO77964.1 helix-turn-helix transcriptional regulator [[Clostridium] asparagiforme DSM 15981]